MKILQENKKNLNYPQLTLNLILVLSLALPIIIIDTTNAGSGKPVKPIPNYGKKEQTYDGAQNSPNAPNGADINSVADGLATAGQGLTQLGEMANAIEGAEANAESARKQADAIVAGDSAQANDACCADVIKKLQNNCGSGEILGLNANGKYQIHLANTNDGAPTLVGVATPQKSSADKSEATSTSILQNPAQDCVRFDKNNGTRIRIGIPEEFTKEQPACLKHLAFKLTRTDKLGSTDCHREIYFTDAGSQKCMINSLHNASLRASSETNLANPDKSADSSASTKTEETLPQAPTLPKTEPTKEAEEATESNIDAISLPAPNTDEKATSNAKEETTDSAEKPAVALPSTSRPLEQKEGKTEENNIATKPLPKPIATATATATKPLANKATEALATSSQRPTSLPVQEAPQNSLIPPAISSYKINNNNTEFLLKVETLVKNGKYALQVACRKDPNTNCANLKWQNLKDEVVIKDYDQCKLQGKSAIVPSKELTPVKPKEGEALLDNVISSCGTGNDDLSKHNAKITVGAERNSKKIDSLFIKNNKLFYPKSDTTLQAFDKSLFFMSSPDVPSSNLSGNARINLRFKITEVANADDSNKDKGELVFKSKMNSDLISNGEGARIHYDEYPKLKKALLNSGTGNYKLELICIENEDERTIGDAYYFNIQ